MSDSLLQQEGIDVKNSQLVARERRQTSDGFWRLWPSRLGWLCALPVALSASAASAATVTVNTTNPDSSSDNLCGLTEAVQAVNQGSTYRSCTYTPNGQSDRIVFSVNGTHNVSELYPTRSVEIMGRGQSNTIITPSGMCAICAFSSSGGAQTIWLRNLTVLTTAPSFFPGIWASPTIPVTLATTGVRISGFAVGLAASGSNVLLQVDSTTIENNGEGVSANDAALQLTSSTIRNNTLGGIRLFQEQARYNYISNSLIQNNTGTNGAGIYVEAMEDDAELPTLDISGSTISGNQASGDGGGVFASTAVNVTSTVFDGNSAGGIGGGYVAYEKPGGLGGFITNIVTTTFKNNVAAFGAGLSNYNPSDGLQLKISVEDSTLGPNNVATSDGGGMYSRSQIDVMQNVTIHGNRAARGGGLFHDSGGESHLFHCTVTANRATQSNGGGGLWLRTGNPRYQYNIFAENRAGAGASPPLGNLTVDPGNASLSARYNLLDDVTGVSHLFPLAPSGTNIVANPQLDSFKNLGGLTSVRPLLASSPALDAIPATEGDSTLADQRGWLRPIDGNFNGTASADIGSVEANPTSTLYEAETLTIAAQSGEASSIENHSSYSGGMGRLKQSNQNGFITLQTGSVQPSTYGVIVWYKKAANAGKFKLFAGTSSSPTLQIGGETDAYRSSVQWTKVNLGTMTVSAAGAQYFKLLASARNASSSAHWMYIDAIQLYKVN